MRKRLYQLSGVWHLFLLLFDSVETAALGCSVHSNEIEQLSGIAGYYLQ